MTADLLDQVCSPAEAAEARRMLNGLTERELDAQIDWAAHTTPREAPPPYIDPISLLETLAAIGLIGVALTITGAALYSAWLWRIAP